jgi:hypothetical protein
MSGGEIIGNSAPYGGGVYANSTGAITMSGSAVVNSNNDVQLSPGRTITVSGTLSGAAPVATITPESYTDGTVVLAQGGSHTITASDLAKFAVTPNNGEAWDVYSDNKIHKRIATRNNGANHYHNISSAIAAARSSATLASPDLITVIKDFDIDSAEITAISSAFSGKHVKLTTDGTTRTLKRATNNTGSFFTVPSGASLTLAGNGSGDIVLDGGAVWTGGTATPPDPAHGATNSGLSATAAIVKVNGGSFTMNDGAIVQNNTLTASGLSGGGVHVATATGTFTMNGGTVMNNSVSDCAGGVFTEGAFLLYGGFVSNNYAAVFGGGILVSGSGSFNMTSGSIIGNKANNNGGGLLANGSGGATISGGLISGNTAWCGAGAETNTFINMSGGSITQNTATNNRTGTNPDGGGGVTVEGGGTLALSGTASISANTSIGKGNGVLLWPNSTMKMTGGAVVAADNDVYLTSGRTITITDTLTGAAPVATITPSSYATSTQVLAESGGSYLADNYTKFALTPSGAWHIANDGRLTQ